MGDVYKRTASQDRLVHSVDASSHLAGSPYSSASRVNWRRDLVMRCLGPSRTTSALEESPAEVPISNQRMDRGWP